MIDEEMEKEMDKMKKILLVILIVLISFSSTGGIYKVYIDREFGFWGVRDISNISNHVDYKDKILNISTGDIIIWENVDTYGDRITIKNDIIWSGERVILGDSKRYSFTFYKAGTYKFHIAENNRVTLTENETNVERFHIRSQTIKVTGPTIFPNTTSIDTLNTLTTNERMNKTISTTSTKVKNTRRYTARIRPNSTLAPIPTVTVPSMATMVDTAPIPLRVELTLYELFIRWYAGEMQIS